MILAAVFALALGGCGGEDAGAPSPGGETACGQGELSFSLGRGDPFSPVEGEPFLIEAGLQGGFHFDVSVRSRGALDADDVDVELTLRQGEVVRARHLVADWLLAIEPGPWCDYTRARLVLVDEAGGLLPRERLDEVAAGPLTLEVALESPLGSGRATLPITLERTPGI